ncbi:MAG: oxidoreductase [Bacteroidetes bacterium]|nr:oxidoreductase [Bacteroidota bacterium]
MNETENIINTGIIGFGLSGKVFHAPFLHTHPGFFLKKIVERHSDESRKIYPYVEIVRDFHDLLNDPGIDLVVVSTPNTLHFPMVNECLLAGKHVVVEKPFTPTSKEAEKLIQLAQSVNRKIFVYQNRRWDGDFLTIKKILKNKLLGDLQEYEAHFDRFKPELSPNAWRDEDKPGGGILFDLGSHLIDQALQLFGKPESIYADIQAQRKGSKKDDYFELNLFYPELKVILKAGMMVKEPGPRFILHGSKGSFIKYGIDPQENKLVEGLMPDTENWGMEKPENRGMLTTELNELYFDGHIETEPGCYQKFYENVYDVFVNNYEIAVKPEEARDVIRIIELAFESSKRKMEIKVKSG